jgi:hypothetical protein
MSRLGLFISSGKGHWSKNRLLFFTTIVADLRETLFICRLFKTNGYNW